MDISEIIEHSYKNFHAKGLDYICLHRSPELTVKVYFFDGDMRKLPEVVAPHDHRYAFDTLVLAGVVSNSLYHRAMPKAGSYAGNYQEFEYRTPLNGGNGFAWKQEARLALYGCREYRRGESYGMDAEEVQTIAIHAPQTALLLRQYEDVVPRDQPTSCFLHDKQVPNLSGLYSKFRPDEVIARMQLIGRLLPTGLSRWAATNDLERLAA